MNLSLATLSPSSIAHATAAAIPHVAIPSVSGVIESGATYATTAARGIGLVDKPLAAAARGTQASGMMKAARFVSRGLTYVVIGASVFNGAQIVQKNGAQALLHTKAGRGAVFGAVGGSLLLIPTPATQLSGAAVLALSAANEFGAMRRLDRTYAAAA